MKFATPTSRSRFRVRFAWFDILWSLSAPVIAVTLRDPSLLRADWSEPTSSVCIFMGVAAGAALLSLIVFRISESMTHVFTVHDLLAIGGAVGLSVALTSVIMFTFTRLDGVPRSTPTIYAMVFGGGLILARVLHRAFVGERTRQRAALEPEALRNVMLVGADRFAVAIAELLSSQSPRTARVIALLEEDARAVGRTVAGVRIVGTTADLGQVLDEYGVHGVKVDQILISNSSAISDDRYFALKALCDENGIDCAFADEAFNLLPKAPCSDAPEPPGEIPEIPAYFEWKRIIDFTAAVILLILLAPLTAIVCVLVLIDVGTPLLFWQQRLGRNGRRFLVFKFRTYRAPFDWRGDPVPDERRLSGLGKFIRATRLDEIPQLLNILVGDMSLIGPRPLLPHDQPSNPTLRLLVPPGITGWAQVNGGNLVTPEEKDALDIWYIRNASWVLDFRIIVKTVVVAVAGERLDRQAVADALALQSEPCVDGESKDAVA